jgi:hypothetical protein
VTYTLVQLLSHNTWESISRFSMQARPRPRPSGKIFYTQPWFAHFHYW